MMCPGFHSRTRGHIWVEFVIGSLLCSKKSFSGFSGFAFPQKKPNISKFQFDPGMHGHFKRVLVTPGTPWVKQITFTFLQSKLNFTVN